MLSKTSLCEHLKEILNELTKAYIINTKKVVHNEFLMISLGSFNKQFQEPLVYYFERLQLFFGQFSTRQDVLCQIPAHLIRSERDLFKAAYLQNRHFSDDSGQWCWLWPMDDRG